MDGDGDSLAMSYLSTNTDQTSLLSVSSHDKSMQESHTSHSTFRKTRSFVLCMGVRPQLGASVFCSNSIYLGFLYMYCLHELRASEVTLVSNTLVHFYFFLAVPKKELHVFVKVTSLEIHFRNIIYTLCHCSVSIVFMFQHLIT